MLKREGKHREWPAIQKLGLLSGVTSFEDYLRRVTLGMARAELTALLQPDGLPGVAGIKELHQVAFGEVHPWAGEFNVPGEDIWIGGILACDPRFIVPELALLREQTRELLEADTAVAKSRAIAFFHVRFERIHPFKDGNGRVGRLIIKMQMNALLGVNIARGTLRPNVYDAAIVKAQKNSNLLPLMNLILMMDNRPALPGRFEPLPFRLRPHQGTVEQKMERRRRARNKV